MKTRLKILQENLLSSISLKLPDFKLNLTKREFRAKRNFGSVAIMVSFIKHGGSDFDITGSVGIRIDAVEDLVNEGNATTTKAEKASTFTMGAEFGNIINGQQKRWTIEDEGDLARVTVGFVQAVEDVGIPYIEKYSDMSKVLEALSGNESPNWLHSPIHGARCQRALALAYILRDNQKIAALTEQNIYFLKTRNDFGLQEFEKLSKKIKALST